MPTDKFQDLKTLYSEMLISYPDGLSSTSTKKFEAIKSFFANWLSLQPNDIYATGAGTRPGNLEVRLSQGLQAIKHTRLGLGFLLDESNSESNRKKLTDSTLVTIRKFIGKGKANYDAILILIQGGNNLFVTEIAYRSKDIIIEKLIAEFDLTGALFVEEIIDKEERYQESANSTDDNGIELERIDPNLQLMVKPFNPSLINIDNKILTIDLFIKRLSQIEPEIDLYPDFQRKDDLWDETKQSRLIESILIRFPLPAFYFDGSNKNKWLVVDGLQRLSSIRNFAIRKTLKLRNLEFLIHLNGLGYDDLDRDLQRIIEETQVVAYIINPGTPDDVKFNIFRRINTGGLILQPQEIRHALFQGTPAKFIAELANTPEFTRYSIKTDRMLDRDFANRFLSFYLFGYEEYTPDLESYMSKAMSHIYKMTELEKENCKADFVASMNLNYTVFGDYAFRKQEFNNTSKKPVNKALFDVFSVVFTKKTDEESQILVNNREKIIHSLISLLATDETFFWSVSTSTSDKNRVNYRFKKIHELVNNILTKQDD